jgi:hypothetical protein
MIEEKREKKDIPRQGREVLSRAPTSDEGVRRGIYEHMTKFL